MPDPNRLVKTLQTAVAACLGTPGRKGRLVHLQDVDEVFVAGDLHGNLANFRRILDLAQLSAFPRRHLVLQELIHGPFRYVSGGDKSHQALDLFAALKCQYPDRVHMLLGNHEMAQWTAQKIAKADEELNGLFYEGVNVAYGRSAPEVYAAYRELFSVLPLAIRTPNRIFLSHSLPTRSRMDNFHLAVLERDSHQEAELRGGGPVHSLVWGRDTGSDHVARFLEKVDADLLITGHIPCPEAGYEAPNEYQIILDSLSEPAAYCLFPTDQPLTHTELLECVGTL